MRVLANIVAALTILGSSWVAGSPLMHLTSPVIASGGHIPLAQSNYGANLSPPLAWSAIPGARSYAIILDDPDAPGLRPFVHWLIWNIPGSATGLPGRLSNASRLANPPGALQGRNDAGDVGYFGPRPPSGVHHYHFRIFALDSLLALPSGAERPALSAAMNGHVIATGELVAEFPAPGVR